MAEPALTQLLYAESEGAPPAGVDLSRIMRDGRRRRLRRRLVAPGLAAATVVALTVGLIAVLPHRAPQPAAGPPVAASLGAAPARFDPLRLHVAALWLPDGLIAQPPQLSQLAQRVWFSEKPPTGGNPVGRAVDVTLYAAGVQPWQLSPPIPEMMPTVEPTDPVNGAPAQWIRYANPGYPDALAWRWADDAWAVARSYVYTGDSDETADAVTERRIAEAVRTDVDVAVPVPFRMHTPPAPLRLLEVGLSATVIDFYTPDHPQAVFGAGLAFGATDQTALTGMIVTQSLGELPQPGSVSVSVYSEVVGTRRKPEPDRTLGGHPASIETHDDIRSITLYDVQGYVVSVHVFAAAFDIIDVDLAIELALSVTILGPPTDRTQWTTNPLR